MLLLSNSFAVKGPRAQSPNGTYPQRFLAEANTPEPLPLPKASSLTEIEQAYLDSYTILKDPGPCSDFFGGPAAIAVLNRLTEQIHPSHLGGRVVGLRMTGKTMIVQNYQSKFTYRLFDKVEANLDGPFYHSSGLPGLSVPRIGLFYPNTREARTTILLHELGHLIRKPDGEWVLPNDGESNSASEDNTDRVLDVCGERIRALRKFTFSEELENAQTTSVARTSPVQKSNRVGLF
jgi:hypothetical protein